MEWEDAENLHPPFLLEKIMTKEVNYKRSKLLDGGFLHIEFVDGDSYLLSLQEIADDLIRLADGGTQVTKPHDFEAPYFDWYCPACGMSLPSTEKHCPNCGGYGVTGE